MSEKPKRTRRKQSTTAPMPELLMREHVSDVYLWPLGRVKTATAAGECWTDVLVILCDAIRLGGRYNSRRVRYDGAFYITHNGRRVYLAGELALHVADIARHVYGLDAQDDKLHNEVLKGY